MHAKVAKSTQIYYFQSLPDGLVGLLVRWAGGNLQVLPHPGHLHFLPLILRAFPVSTLPNFTLNVNCMHFYYISLGLKKCFELQESQLERL